MEHVKSFVAYILLLCAVIALVFVGISGKEDQRASDLDQPVLSALSGYQLVWSDEFSGTQLDESKWRYQRGGWNGSQVQNCYVDENTTVSGGTLKITARYEPGYNCFDRTTDFTSGFVQTKDRAWWTYGYFEARVKVPSSDSTWPAFWMSPQFDNYGPWPKSGEIDIFEIKGHDMSTAYANAHWGNSGGDKRQAKGPMNVGDATQWHVYAVEWNLGELRFYLDGVHVHTISSFPEPNAGTDPQPFDIPYFLRLNMAVGGTYLSAPHNDANNGIAQLPATMEVDYVRVYQKAPNLSPSVNPGQSYVFSQSDGAGTVVATVAANDPEGDVLSSWRVDSDGGLPVSINSFGQVLLDIGGINIAPGDYTILVSVTDGELRSTSESVDFEVLQVNQPTPTPTVTPVQTPTAAPNSTPQPVPSSQSGSSPSYTANPEPTATPPTAIFSEEEPDQAAEPVQNDEVAQNTLEDRSQIDGSAAVSIEDEPSETAPGAGGPALEPQDDEESVVQLFEELAETGPGQEEGLTEEDEGSVLGSAGVVAAYVVSGVTFSLIPLLFIVLYRYSKQSDV